jgi:hypothetical protein
MRHLSCNQPTNQRCNHDDPEECCGGGCDEPCSCLHCHPERTAAVVAVKETLEELHEVLLLAVRRASALEVIARAKEYRITDALSIVRKTRGLRDQIKDLL